MSEAHASSACLCILLQSLHEPESQHRSALPDSNLHMLPGCECQTCRDMSTEAARGTDPVAKVHQAWPTNESMPGTCSSAVYAAKRMQLACNPGFIHTACRVAPRATQPPEKTPKTECPICRSGARETNALDLLPHTFEHPRCPWSARIEQPCSAGQAPACGPPRPPATSGAYGCCAHCAGTACAGSE